MRKKRNGPKRRVPNHIRKMLYLQKIGALPSGVGIHRYSIYHDDWCQHWEHPGRCNCNPDIRLRYSLPAGGAN